MVLDVNLLIKLREKAIRKILKRPKGSRNFPSYSVPLFTRYLSFTTKLHHFQASLLVIYEFNISFVNVNKSIMWTGVVFMFTVSRHYCICHCICLNTNLIHLYIPYRLYKNGIFRKSILHPSNTLCLLYVTPLYETEKPEQLNFITKFFISAENNA